jgi:small subunit ribosomal protein S16
MIKIKLARTGKKDQPNYRIVVALSTTKRSGKYIDKIGNYSPETKKIEINKEKLDKWISNGAQPTDSIKKLLKIS